MLLGGVLAALLLYRERLALSCMPGMLIGSGKQSSSRSVRGISACQYIGVRSAILIDSDVLAPTGSVDDASSLRPMRCRG